MRLVRPSCPIDGDLRSPIAEIAVAMCLPFAVLLVPLRLGTMSGGALMLAGHEN